MRWHSYSRLCLLVAWCRRCDSGGVNRNGLNNHDPGNKGEEIRSESLSNKQRMTIILTSGGHLPPSKTYVRQCDRTYKSTEQGA